MATRRFHGGGISGGVSAKTQIQTGLPDDLMDKVPDVVQKAAPTGMIGDGKICVGPLSQMIRTRTGETGETAI